MALVTVLGVRTHEAPGLRYAIDGPAKGAKSDTHALPISGWVHGREVAVSAVVIVHEQLALREAPVRLPRQDTVKEIGQEASQTCGFWVNVGMLGLGEEFDLTVQALLASGSYVPLATIICRRMPLAAPTHGRMQPIMVTNLGRCGSTLIMRMLAEHPDIVAHHLHPLETRALGYWLHAMRVLAEPASHHQSSHPNTYQHDAFWIGSHPHNMHPLIGEPLMRDFFGRAYPEMLAEHVHRAADEFYFRTAMSQGRQRTPQYFAEKANPNHVPRLMWELYPRAKEIFLVRDFRDMVRSMLDWYRKLGAVSFGREKATDDVEFVRRHRFQVERMLRHYRERKDRAYLVRYEDLIREPERTLGQILEYIGVGAARATVEGMVTRANSDSPDFQKHRTSSNVNASIGRWRDWDPALVAACHETFDDLLPEFGYDPAGDGATTGPQRRRTAEALPAAVRQALPWGAAVAVAAKGDDALLRRVGDDARHFPADETGTYLGYYPEDGADAIAQVERARSSGAAFLYFPPDALWWLEHYTQLRSYLDEQCKCIVRDDDAGALYRLTTPAAVNAGVAQQAS